MFLTKYFLNRILKNPIFWEISQSTITDSVSLSARTTFPWSTAEKAAVHGEEASTGTTPGEMRTGCFLGPTIMKVGSMLPGTARVHTVHFNGLLAARTSLLPMIYTANSESSRGWFTSLNQRHTDSTSQGDLVQNRMRRGKTTGQGVGIRMEVLETDLK